VVDTEQTLERVRVRVGRLKGPAGILPRDAVDVRIAQMLARVVVGCYNVVGQDLIVMPWLPDKLQPADITGRRQFWLTIHIPDDAQAGIYETAVKVIPRNAPATELTLEVTVPPFDLREPQFEYSVYYPVWLYDESMSDAFVEKYGPLTAELYLAECRNMVAHGCTNPNIYAGAEVNKDGSLDFTTLGRYLDVREQAGMGPGGPLYIFDGGNKIVSRDLTKEEWERNVEATREIVAWCQTRGYDEVYFMAGDELTGEALRAERDSFESIHEGGGKIYVACCQDFFGIVGDLLDCPVLLHPGRADDILTLESRNFLQSEEALAAYNPRQLLAPRIQELIKGVHDNGFKIFTYMDPVSGHAQPDMHRRHRGLGLWKTGIDGTMTWAYIHIRDKGGPKPNGSWVNVGGRRFVVRGPEGPVDTLGWEAYREGYDDARYLATLQDAIAKAGDRGRQAQQWLDSITVDADLDAWRWEMARQIELLQ